jgi:sugar phosphate isomerase/epimerase
MVKLACMTLPYAHVSFERALEGISRAGYRYVAFGLPHQGIEVPEENDGHTVECLNSLFTRYELQPVMLISTNQLAPGQPIARARKRLETAKALGIQEVLSLGTWGYRAFPDEPLPEAEMRLRNDAFVDKFRLIATEAEALDIHVTIKPHTGNTATAFQMKKTLDLIGSPFVKASYDPGNVHYYEGVDSLDDMSAAADDLISFVAKDHRGLRANADFPIPGEGNVDFPGLFSILVGTGFSGSIVVERVDGTHSGAMKPEEIDQRIQKARENLQRLLKEAGYSC